MARPWDAVGPVILTPEHIKFMEDINTVITQTNEITKGWPVRFMITLEKANMTLTDPQKKLTQWFLTLERNVRKTAGFLETTDLGLQRSHTDVERAIHLIIDMRATQQANTPINMPGIPALNAIIDAHQTTAATIINNSRQIGDHVWTALHMLAKIVENLQNKASFKPSHDDC